MKFLIIGLGSMGCRRIRCLKELGISTEDIYGYDINEERRHEASLKFDIITMPSLIIPPEFVLIISTPPDKHLEYINLAIDNNVPCFVEASVILEDIPDNPLVHPSATMRFCNDVICLKNDLQRMNCIKFEYRCVSWLPDWHPSEDITKFYVSKKETGACREMVPFELEWLCWIFGEVKQVKGVVGSTGMFGEIDDHYHILIEFESGTIGYILIDIITKEAKGGYREISFSEEDEKGS